LTTPGNHKARRREQILTAAAHCFAAKGFAGTAVADIALKAGIGKGTVYEYFSSKNDLFFAVFEWYSRRIEAAAVISADTLSGSARQRLQCFGRVIIRQWSEIRELFSLVMEFWAAAAASQMQQRFKRAFRQAYNDYRKIVASLIREGIERGEFRSDLDPQAIAAAVVGTWDALFMQAWFEEGFDPVQVERSFAEVLFRGLERSKS
jgi:AcrR family transcriptional regulator